MQEQLQVEKTYTFEDICPEWSAIIAEYGFEGVRGQHFRADDKVRAISDCVSCIVGESHGG